MRLTKKEKDNEYGYAEYSSEMSKAISIKLGQYEDIDESPEHLANIKKALEIIIKKKPNLKLIEQYANYFDYWEYYGKYLSRQLTKEEFDIVKEVLL